MTNSTLDVYVYGMTVLSTIHQLEAAFPTADSYQEIAQTFVIPGGEGANAAIVLANLGLRVALDGCHLGDLTAGLLVDYLTAQGLDCARMTPLADFPGWRDIVFCGGASRTVFGWFRKCLFDGVRRWTEPDEDAIQAARCVALDPFFVGASARVAELCVEHQTDYVTIDCKWDDPIAQSVRAVVVSRQFIDREYADQPVDDLLAQYRAHCQGLIIFTFGSQPALYASPATEPATMPTFPVEAVDTLAAGDTFRAGVVYGVLQGFSDAEIVRFAAATATVACTRFPGVHEPPTLDEINALLQSV